MSINRGDIFYVNPSETVGSEQRSGRPAIIVSNPLCNEHSPVVEVVYLTCQYKKPMPTHVRIESAGKRSTALCEQISSVDVSRLGDFKGHLTDREIQSTYQPHQTQRCTAKAHFLTEVHLRTQGIENRGSTSVLPRFIRLSRQRTRHSCSCRICAAQ